MKEYILFAGCTIGNRIPFIEASARLVFNKFGIQISEAPFSCCSDIAEFLALSMGFDLKEYGIKYHRIRLYI